MFRSELKGRQPARALCGIFRLLLVIGVGSIPVSAQESESDRFAFFERRIRPIFANQCFACHNPKSKLGGLQIDSRASLLQGGSRGPAIVPGDPEASLLIRATTHQDPNLKMPMGGQLKDQEIEALRTWVTMGAPWPEIVAAESPDSEKGRFVPPPERRKFWSFQPLRKPSPPNVRDKSWAKSPIDKFILAKLEEKGLKAGKRADKRTLIRRATFDLTGLPPAPKEIDAFLADSSPDAFGKVVERLLASPRYGERWGRHWLDVARYTDREVRIRKDYSDAWRYRDWVIDAFNQDLRYDQFVKAQIAADLLSEEKDPKLLPALGFISLGTWIYQGDIPYVVSRADELDDRVDVLTRGFLGLTVACARCHDHKYDPISQKDYYALAGVFASTDYHQYFLVPDDVVAKHKEHQQKIQDKKGEIQKLLTDVGSGFQARMAEQISRYMMAARKLHNDLKLEPSKVAQEDNLDQESLERWVRYLDEDEREHSYLREWDALTAKGGTDVEAQAVADEFQKAVFAVMAEQKAVEEENRPVEGDRARDSSGARTFKPDGKFYYDRCSSCEATRKVLEREEFYFWGDLFRRTTRLAGSIKRPAGVFEYQDEALLRFLLPEQKAKYDLRQAELKDLEESSPAEPAYIMGMMDSPAPANMRVNIRGNVNNLGDEVSRGFPAVLGKTEGEPLLFSEGSGRLELAEAIVRHPLTPRVMVNRIWAHHFGRGIVATPSNFGQTGERPIHPELLDYLATRFVESNWSIKAMHREIMLSTTYQLSSEASEASDEIDADNRFFSRANNVRLDAEALRDSLLFVAGNLDMKAGGPPSPLSIENERRTVYRKVSRAKVDHLMALFDFPDPTLTSEQRSTTNVPLQGLFFLNSDLVLRQAQFLAERLRSHGGNDDAARLQYVYPLLYGREATEAEIRLGLEFLNGGQTEPGSEAAASAGATSRWQRYAQVLLVSGEFYFID